MAEIKQHADGSVSFRREADAQDVTRVGGPKAGTANAPTFKGVEAMEFAANGGTDTGGGIVSWQNELGYDIIVLLGMLNVTTIATAACSVEVGETGTNGTTAASNIISSQDVHTGTGEFIGSVVAIRVPAGNWLTASVASGASAGLVGVLKVFYVVA